MAVSVSFQVSHKKFLKFKKTGKMYLEIKHVLIAIDPKNRLVEITDTETGEIFQGLLVNRLHSRFNDRLFSRYELFRP